MDFFFKFHILEINPVVLYYPQVLRLLISCKAVKYEGLRRPQRFDAFKVEPPLLPLDQEDERCL